MKPQKGTVRLSFSTGSINTKGIKLNMIRNFKLEKKQKIVLIFIAAFLLLVLHHVKIYFIGGNGITLSGYQYRIENNYVILKGYLGTKRDLTFPGEISGKPVVAIEEFFTFQDLETVEIPEGVLYIKNSAFARKRKLRDIKIPDSVLAIEAGAFYECAELEEIVLPPHIKVIKRGTFYECEKLKSVTLPKQLRVIEKDSFSGCQSLESIEIPGNVYEFQDSAFSSCFNLKEVILSGSLKSAKAINKYTFEDTQWYAQQKESQEFVVLGGTLVEYNGNETKVVIPDDVTVIGRSVFYENESISEVVIPSSVAFVCDNAFASTNLKRMYLGDGAGKFGYSAMEYSKLDELVFQGNLPKDNGYSLIKELSSYVLSDIIIYGREGSDVEMFAKENYLNFKTLDENGEIPEVVHE